MSRRPWHDVLMEAAQSITDRRYEMALDQLLDFLRSTDSQDEQSEALALSRLNHPHVVSVYDMGMLEDGRRFIAMEYVQGKTLRQWCQAATNASRTALRDAGRSPVRANVCWSREVRVDL